ncbi:MAG: hypothetical protein ACREMF_03935 [Gemmatimonadales bacterium]
MQTIRRRLSGLTAALALGLAASGAAQGMGNPGREMMPASDLRVGLNNLLAEHVYLAGAAGALDANSIALSKAIGSVYGADAEVAFLALWRKHIGFVVDYTTGVATKDKTKSDKSVQDLQGYANDFGAFLGVANPNLPTAVVADLVRTHIVTLKSVIDAQAAGNQATAFLKAREAAAHMQMIADPLAAAIAKQFPERFASR